MVDAFAVGGELDPAWSDHTSTRAGMIDKGERVAAGSLVLHQFKSRLNC